MLRGNDGIDDGCQIVDVGKRFYTKDNIVKCAFSTRGCLFRCSYDCINFMFSTWRTVAGETGSKVIGASEGGYIPWRGLNRSLPKLDDLKGEIVSTENFQKKEREWARARRGERILEGYSVLRHMLKARLPHEGDVAGVRRLKPP